METDSGSKKIKVPINVNNKKIGTKGRASIPFDENKFKSIEKVKKTTLRSLSRAMGVSHTTVCRWKKKGTFESTPRQSNRYLQTKINSTGLIFCLSSCILDEQTSNFTFNDMSNVVHMDEKLFYITRTQQTFYLT